MSTTRPAVLVTGAAQGIGASITQRLVHDGYVVFAVDTHPPPWPNPDGSPARQLRADARDLTAMRAVVSAIGESDCQLEALVNNAAWYTRAALDKCADPEWQNTINGVLGPVQATTRAVLPILLGRGHGSIVNVASINGLVGAPGHAAYATAKGAIHALTRQLAVEYGPRGIRVNSVSPALIETERSPGPADPHDRELAAQAYPLRRFGEPTDVAAAVSFLLGQQAKFITGIDLPIDGGLLATSPAAVISTGLRAAWELPSLTVR